MTLAAARVLCAGLASAAVLSSRAEAQVSPGPLARPHAELEGNATCMRCHATQGEGMDEKCLDCHAEIAFLRGEQRGFHARTGEAKCASCHPDHAGTSFELIEWPGGSERGFDHRSTGWPLRGRHAALQCRDCHQAKYRTGKAAALAKRKDPSRSFVGLEPACAACHADPHRGALGTECARCHGFNRFQETTGFDHGTTAFPLSGKHVALACAKCHQKTPAAAPVYRPIPHAECSACHADPHAGRLGPKCASCHVATSFRDVPATAVDHDRTRYPLRGAHRALSCAKCHDPKSAWGKRPRFAACVDCHRDAHAGRATLAGAAADCSACHSIDSFMPGVLAAARHAPKSFPLEGKHTGIACAKCHVRRATPDGRAKLGPAAVEIHPAHERCTTCHTDAHGGQLSASAGAGGCEDCHSVAGWTPALYTVARHKSARFPLEGAHAKAACSACHGPKRRDLTALPASLVVGRAGVALRGIEQDCAACHRDPHRFGEAQACTDCHDAESFSPARYGPAEHARAAFPLEGAHRAVPCFACHEELKLARAPSSSLIRARDAGRTLALQVARHDCVDCHADPHGGQFAATGATAPARGCAGCHDSQAFRPASKFDHDRDSAFRLGRAHQNVACERCHALPSDSKPRTVRIFRGVTSRCEDCHGPKPRAPGGAS